MTAAAIIPALISAAASIGGGLLSRGGSKETETQGVQRNLINELLASVKGNGPFSDLFQKDDEAFQKGFVDPAMSRFRNQIAPQIKEQFSAGGKLRGSAFEDSLSRAGVDINSLLNEQMLNFQQGKESNISSALSSILGAGAGAERPLSTGQALGQSISGFLSQKSGQQSVGALGEGLQGLLSQLFGGTEQQQPQQQGIQQLIRRPGFEESLARSAAF